eukprot:scaffold301_cov243-Pinguiococcus_pyrenoidosus.AAC.112
MALQLGALVGESAWADVILKAGNRPLFAHSVVLATRSDYFRAMLCGNLSPLVPPGGRSALGLAKTPVSVEIEMPGSFGSLYRMVHFLYTGRFQPAGTGAQSGRPQCLVAFYAKHSFLRTDSPWASRRYGIPDFLEVVESAITVDETNVGAILSVCGRIASASRWGTSSAREGKARTERKNKRVTQDIPGCERRLLRFCWRSQA